MKPYRVFYFHIRQCVNNKEPTMNHPVHIHQSVFLLLRTYHFFYPSSLWLLKRLSGLLEWSSTSLPLFVCRSRFLQKIDHGTFVLWLQTRALLLEMRLQQVGPVFIGDPRPHSQFRPTRYQWNRTGTRNCDISRDWPFDFDSGRWLVGDRVLIARCVRYDAGSRAQGGFAFVLQMNRWMLLPVVVVRNRYCSARSFSWRSENPLYRSRSSDYSGRWLDSFISCPSKLLGHAIWVLDSTLLGFDAPSINIFFFGGGDGIYSYR